MLLFINFSFKRTQNTFSFYKRFIENKIEINFISNILKMKIFFSILKIKIL